MEQLDVITFGVRRWRVVRDVRLWIRSGVQCKLVSTDPRIPMLLDLMNWQALVQVDQFWLQYIPRAFWNAMRRVEDLSVLVRRGIRSPQAGLGVVCDGCVKVGG